MRIIDEINHAISITTLMYFEIAAPASARVGPMPDDLKIQYLSEIHALLSKFQAGCRLADSPLARRIGEECGQPGPMLPF